MKRRFTARVWKETGMYVAQCVEFEIASQGYTEDDALDMLKNAIELFLSEPDAGILPADVKIREVQVDAA